MNNTYGERSFAKRPDDSRIPMHNKNPLNHHPSLPAMPPSYGHVPSVSGPSSLSAVAAGGRSHSCSSPGSSASSICSTGMSMGGSDAYGMYGDADYTHNQPPPLINPRSNHHRYSNQANMSPVATYSPGGSQSSNPSLMSSPLPFGNAPSAQTSSPSGSVSSASDFVTLSSSPSVPVLDPAFKSVLQFVNQRWKAVQEKQAKNASSIINSTFGEATPAVVAQPGNSPSVSSPPIARCTAPPQTMPVP